MRKGYLFIRGRTQFVTLKTLLFAFSVVAVAAAAVPRPTTGEPWRPLDTHETARAAAASQATADMTCADFDNQAEAQAFFASTGPVDAHPLDRDRNGVACERLP